MDIYTYIAESNPYQAKSILHKYGYSATNIKDYSDLGVCLKKLVAAEGEDAFNDILDSHPDKGVILEKYSAPKKDNYNNHDGSECNCPNCRRHNGYMNADGAANTTPPSQVAKETSVFILAAALLLAAAIIVKK